MEDMLLVKRDVRYVRYLWNGTVCGVLVVDIALERSQGIWNTRPSWELEQINNI